MFLSLNMIFSLERASIVSAILERISGFDPSLEMIAPRYLKFSTSSSLWPFILISLWKPLGLFVITFVLSGPISILYLVVVLSRRSVRTPASSSSSAFMTMSSAKRKLIMSLPPMLILPSWSSKASRMILSRKMLKRVGESRHPCALWCSFRLWNLLALLLWSLLLVAGVCVGWSSDDLTRMADEADGSVVLAQLQVAFLWESDN